MKNPKRYIALLISAVLLLSVLTSCSAPEKEITQPAVTTAPSEEETSVTAINTVTIGAAGDVLIHRPIYNGALQDNGEYDFSQVFSAVKDTISDFDYFIANLETTFGGTHGRVYSGYPLFNSPDSLSTALKAAGVDCVLTANNHTFDSGTEGALRTISTVKSAGLDYIGTRENTSQKQYMIKEIGGINFGFICYTYETIIDEGYKALNGILVDEEAAGLINSFRPHDPDEFYTELQDNINKMKAENADVIAVFIHWGEEYQIPHNDVQSEIAQKICDMGVDAIIGGHPHVVQPVRTLTSTDGSHETFCVYSLGNFVSNQRRYLMGIKTGHTEDGIIAKMTFTKFSDGSVTMDSTEIIPTWVHLYYENNKAVHSIVPLNKDIDENAEALGLTKSSDGITEAKASKERTEKVINYKEEN